jgi:hypothetical protein
MRFDDGLGDGLTDPAESPPAVDGAGGGAWWSDLAGRRRAATESGGTEARSDASAHAAKQSGGYARWQRLPGRGSLR